MNEKEEELALELLNEALAATDLDQRNAILGHYLGLTKAAEQRTNAEINFMENVKLMDEADLRRGVKLKK